MTIRDATNINRTYIAKDLVMNADFNSDIADFKDMPMGSVQIVWTGASGASINGVIKLHASNLPEDQYFDDCEIDGAVFDINTANGSRLWIRDRLAFRYLQARYTKGSIVTGTISIIALGKKS